MKIVCAPDSFKESLSALEVAAAMARGVRRVVPDAEVVEYPMADGGEGFVRAMAVALDAELREVDIRDALGRHRRGTFALAGDLAIIEVAEAVGLGLIAEADRDIMRSTSVGVGQLIKAALDAGAQRIVLGLGGSATNDGGAGMLGALGVRFLDAKGDRVAPVPAELKYVTHVDASRLDKRLAGVRIEAACDVTAPLAGPSGASVVYGPQKGAAPEQVAKLDQILVRLATAAGFEPEALLPGSGAAGGLGWALMSFLGAATRPGADLVAEVIGLEERIAWAELVLTGEGSVDAQTLDGKTVAGVAAVARKSYAACIVLAGRVSPDADALLDHGVTAIMPIVPGPVDTETALANAAENIERAAATAVRIWVHHR